MYNEHTHEKMYTNLEVKELPGSEIEIVGEIPESIVRATREKAVRKIAHDLELPGFRKGHVPEDMAASHVGEAAIMQEVAEMALGHTYAHIVEDEKLDVIGRPNITITKLAQGNPIGFKITTAVFPEVTLPDYKKLAAEEHKKHDDPEKEEITDDEVQKELERLQGMFAGAAEAAEDKENETKDDENKKEEGDKTKEKKAPELNDDFAKQLGNFKDLAELKEKIKEGKLMDKKQKAHEKRRLAVADAILVKTKVDIPAVFVEGELDQMVASFTERVTRAGMKMDDYLKQAEKTMDDLRKEWKTDAEKRAKLQITLSEIAKKEKITPNVDKLEREVKHVHEHYPDAEDQAIRSYVQAQMVNELVFDFLEGKEVSSNT